MDKPKVLTFEVVSIVLISLFSLGLFLSVLNILGIITLSWFVCTSPIWIPCISLITGGLYFLIALHYHDLVIIKIGEEKKRKTKTKPTDETRTTNRTKTTSRKSAKTNRRTSKKD